MVDLLFSADHQPYYLPPNPARNSVHYLSNKPLATSLEGWSCLCQLSSAINLRENSDTPCTLDMLAACSSDLIAISKHPQLLKEIFPNHLYVNLQDPNEAEHLSTLARQLDLPTVVTHPVYYLI